MNRLWVRKIANREEIKKLPGPRDAWGAQSVNCLTLGFGSGHDLTVRGSEPHAQLCADSVEPAWGSLSLSLSLSLSQNK